MIWRKASPRPVPSRIRVIVKRTKDDSLRWRNTAPGAVLGAALLGARTSASVSGRHFKFCAPQQKLKNSVH